MHVRFYWLCFRPESSRYVREKNAASQTTAAGIEPAIPGSVGRCLDHWATGPLKRGQSKKCKTSPREVSAIFATGAPDEQRSGAPGAAWPKGPGCSKRQSAKARVPQSCHFSTFYKDLFGNRCGSSRAMDKGHSSAHMSQVLLQIT